MERKTIRNSPTCMKFYKNSILLCGSSDGNIHPYDIVNKNELKRVCTSGKNLAYLEVVGDHVSIHF